MKPIGLAVLIGLSFILVGCVSTPQEAMSLQAKDADDFELDADDYSRQLRFMYPLTWAEPDSANNLDLYLVDRDPNKNISDGQKVYAALSVGHINPLAAATQLLLMEANKTKLSDSYKETLLITVRKFDREEDWNKQAQSLVKLATKTTATAYGENAEVGSWVKGGIFQTYETVKDKNNPFCINDAKGMCLALTNTIPQVLYDNNGYIPFAPHGDYIVAKTYLPPGFPIEIIKFVGVKGVQQYLYVPPMKEIQNKELWKMGDRGKVEEWYKLDRFSINPYLKRLNDGEIMYFNQKLTAKQKDKYSLYKVFDI